VAGVSKSVWLVTGVSAQVSLEVGGGAAHFSTLDAGETRELGVGWVDIELMLAETILAHKALSTDRAAKFQLASRPMHFKMVL